MSSLPHQDPSSPGAVAGATFPVARKGFDPTAVRDFLRQVSQELGRAQQERDRLGRELEQAREADRRMDPEDLDEATVAAKLGEEAARVLATAHEAAVQIRARAEEATARTLREAELDAARQRGEAEVEAARRRQEAEDHAEAEIAAAKAEGREMVAEARAVRERIFSDLTRRRDLARQQIEALHLGRRQMMESFRGARSELDAILAELEAHAPDEADEELPPLDLPDSGPAPVTGPGAVLVLGEMDVPAVIVERHLEPAPEPRPTVAPLDGADEEGEVDADEPAAEVIPLSIVTAEVDMVEVDIVEVDMVEVEILEVEILEVEIDRPDEADAVDEVTTGGATTDELPPSTLILRRGSRPGGRPSFRRRPVRPPACIQLGQRRPRRAGERRRQRRPRPGGGGSA